MTRIRESFGMSPIIIHMLILCFNIVDTCFTFSVNDDCKSVTRYGCYTRFTLLCSSTFMNISWINAYGRGVRRAFLIS